MRPTRPGRGYRERSTPTLPVLLTHRFGGGLVLHHGITERVERLARIFPIGNQLQNRDPAVGDDQRLSGALDLTEEFEGPGLELRLRYRSGAHDHGPVTMDI